MEFAPSGMCEKAHVQRLYRWFFDEVLRACTDAGPDKGESVAVGASSR